MLSGYSAVRVLILQVDMLRGNLFGSYDDFGKKYCIMPSSPAPAGGRGWRPKYMGSNPANANELHQLLLANVMVRRTKGQSGVTLPEKTRLNVRSHPACTCTSVSLCVPAHNSCQDSVPSLRKQS